MEPQKKLPHEIQLDYARPEPEPKYIMREWIWFAQVIGVVVVILAVLLFATRFGHSSWYQANQSKTARDEIAKLASAIEQFKQDTGHYPKSDDGLLALVIAPPSSKNWRGPYIPAIKADPWGHSYMYFSPGILNPKPYEVFSTGPDGQIGNGDDIGNR